MTVHKSKGLEFPVVILADLSAGLTGVEGCNRWVATQRNLCAQRLLRCAPWELIDHQTEEEQAERDEAARVAYVAATRAKDLLVVCALGDTEYEDGWLQPLYEALYPPKDRRRKPEMTGGDETILNAPAQPQEEQIRPGVHRPKLGDHRVLWFDPKALESERSGVARRRARAPSGRHARPDRSGPRPILPVAIREGSRD